MRSDQKTHVVEACFKIVIFCSLRKFMIGTLWGSPMIKHRQSTLPKLSRSANPWSSVFSYNEHFTVIVGGWRDLEFTIGLLWNLWRHSMEKKRRDGTVLCDSCGLQIGDWINNLVRLLTSTCEKSAFSLRANLGTPCRTFSAYIRSNPDQS